MPYTEFVTMLLATSTWSPEVGDRPLSPEPTRMPPSRALLMVLFSMLMFWAPCHRQTPEPTITAPPGMSEMYRIGAEAVPLACVVKPPAYVPGATCTTVPAPARCDAARMVRKGDAWEPSLESEPEGET